MNSKQNRYSLSSESRRWWWPSATAGGVGVAAIAAIVVLPTTGHAIPVDDAGPGPTSAAPSSSRSQPAPTHPCFLVQARWNTALDGPQPECGGVVHVRHARTGVLRPGLDDGP